VTARNDGHAAGLLIVFELLISHQLLQWLKETEIAAS